MVRSGRELLRFDFADNMYAIKGENPDDDVALQAVFIGRNINSDEIKKAGNVISPPLEKPNDDFFSLDTLPPLRQKI